MDLIGMAEALRPKDQGQKKARPVGGALENARRKIEKLEKLPEGYRADAH
jgi:hypothetical protein